MDDSDLPKKYDAIILGTGMVESIVAAAISRIGKSVLHLDCQEYYGENWASFNLENIETWIGENQNKNLIRTTEDHRPKALADETEILIPVKKESALSNVCYNEYITPNKKCEEKLQHEMKTEEDSARVCNEEKSEEEKKNEGLRSDTLEQIKKLSKRFNLDLCPKLLFSKGSMVELLISSNIAKYAEFKSLNRVLTWRNNQLEPVPCSRADVFSTKNVSVVQKRILVKMLTLFAKYTENLDEFNGFENKSLLDYLTHKKIPDNLIHYILYAIAMGDERTSCLSGVKACKAFLESLGRYGNTPFIFPMYGSGELPQCFCRLCAVFGGIYCLHRGVEAVIVKGNKCVGVVSNGVRLEVETMILSSNYNLEGYSVPRNDESISRGIFITDRSILKSEKESLTLLQFPPVPKFVTKPVTVLELGSGTNTCPENYYVVHLTTKTTKDASSDLKFVIESLFDNAEKEIEEKDSKPQIVWSLTWNVNNGYTLNGSPLENVKMCRSVDPEFDYETSINEAKRIFHELYPDEEFLPRAPDPDEIVLEPETSNNNTDETVSTEPEVETNAEECNEHVVPDSDSNQEMHTNEKSEIL